ncbi:MAG: TIGR00159 family protein [Chloroflexi bacterium]|nr:TIGR00159 family protein [Chloroflexota bacterium]
MIDLLQAILSTVEGLGARNVLDILIIAFIFYWLLVLLKGTTAMSLLRGIATVFIVAYILGYLFQLTMLNWLLKNSLPALLIVIPVLFQPELRRALERIGRTSFTAGVTSSPIEQVIANVCAAASLLADRRCGALLVLERETGLQDYADSGVLLDASPSVELIMSVFYPNSPLHDGAMILRDFRVAAASCVLPLSENASAIQSLGTRHRAAIGITERTDSISVVVSEETGAISVCSNGRIVKNLDEARLRRVLSALFHVSADTTLTGRRVPFWARRG